MSKRDRLRRKAMIIAIVEKQKYLKLREQAICMTKVYALLTRPARRGEAIH